MSEHQHGENELDLSVVLPAYNEEAAIVAVVEEIRSVLGAWDGSWEIIVVDDASSDGTAERAEAAGCRVIRCPENGGSGAARKIGIRAARGTLVAMLDADGSYDPTHLPELLSYFPTYDQVNGARTSEQGAYPLLRAPAKWMIRKLAELISGKRIPDLNTGMKVFKRGLMMQYCWAMPAGFSCVTSMTLAFLCNGHSVKYVPVRYRKRVGASKFHPIFDSAKYLATIARMIMYFRPLRIFFPLAAALFALGVGKSAYDLSVSPLGLHDSDVILILSAIFVLLIGMLADLIVAQRRDLQAPPVIASETSHSAEPLAEHGSKPWQRLHSGLR